MTRVEIPIAQASMTKFTMLTAPGRRRMKPPYQFLRKYCIASNLIANVTVAPMMFAYKVLNSGRKSGFCVTIDQTTSITVKYINNPLAIGAQKAAPNSKFGVSRAYRFCRKSRVFEQDRIPERNLRTCYTAGGQWFEDTVQVKVISLLSALKK